MLLDGLGKTEADDEPLPYSKILKIIGLSDTLWYLDKDPYHEREIRTFALACARRVEHLTDDARVKHCNDVQEKYLNREATLEELNVAVRAARVATRSTAWAAPRLAAEASVEAAAQHGRWTAFAAARAAAKAAEENLQVAAWAAESEWQQQKLLEIVGDK